MNIAESLFITIETSSQGPHRYIKFTTSEEAYVVLGQVATMVSKEYNLICWFDIPEELYTDHCCEMCWDDIKYYVGR